MSLCYWRGDQKAMKTETTTDASLVGRRHFVCRAVFSARNSECPSARIEDLDSGRGWWTDDSMGVHYLHVWHKDGETVHRVYCRAYDNPRLKMDRGKLMWLFPRDDRALPPGPEE